MLMIGLNEVNDALVINVIKILVLSGQQKRKVA